MSESIESILATKIATTGKMSSTTKLPTEVIDAIKAGRKIDAIKLLRESNSLGLKEAKHAVDAYIRANPAIAEQYSTKQSGGLQWLIAFLFAAYVAYHFLS